LARATVAAASHVAELEVDGTRRADARNDATAE
jgi:hypothetical protein